MILKNDFIGIRNTYYMLVPPYMYIPGNKLMTEGRYEDAIGSYDKAVELDWTNAVYLCNR